MHGPLGQPETVTTRDRAGPLQYPADAVDCSDYGMKGLMGKFGAESKEVGGGC